MNRSDALDVLAQRYGIESEYVDAHGTVHVTAAETKRALLAALDIDAGSSVQAQAALAAREAADWESALPPVVVAIRDDIRVPIVASPGSAVRWQLTLEDGSERTETVAFDKLAFLDAAEREGRRVERREVRLPADIADGYHRFRVGAAGAEMTLIVTPGRCWLPPSIEAGAQLSGIALQLYLLRSATNWGIGDFTDLRAFVEIACGRGLDVIGLNPLHEMFFDKPEHASPYSPASRLLLNALNIDVTAIPESACDRAQSRLRESDFAARLRACRESELVDYSGVSALKFDVLRLIFAAFAGAASPERQQAFERHRALSTPAMQRTHLFIALREHFAALDPAGAAWENWPPDYRDPDSPAVARFGRDEAYEITFIQWLQWIADTQLAAAAQAAKPMRVGLYRDLAVGADAGGAETWSNQRAVVSGARVGAPPDIHNTAGQNWDLPPFHPQALRDEAYRSFVELVRANMRHAGGLRIDHVMALQQVYWIPRGASPADGAYVRYPLDDLLGILALESHRARCLVVGEDLGTVPAGFRERMAEANVLSYRVVFFERNNGEDPAFIAPDAYPRLALAVLGSHDLPTLGAWLAGADIRLRERLGLVAAGAAVAELRQQREHDRDALIAAFEDAGALPAEHAVNRETVFAAAHAFLARTSAALAVAQIDDVTDEIDPVNVPTTSDEHPNWRRRLSRTIEELPADARFAALITVLADAGRLRV